MVTDMEIPAIAIIHVIGIDRRVVDVTVKHITEI
jgi:predicted regulator of amino acid metabolism with ACT domain